MTNPVDSLIEAFAKAGATSISIHPEATIHLNRSLELIRSLNCRAGIALNPATPTECITWCIHQLDYILIMTVNPGFGGQSLISDIIPKIQQLHHKYTSLTLAVDGGVNAQNISQLAAAGATEFIIGSALLNTSDYSKTVENFYQLLNQPQ
jgi:ribulose-phosphate 3-epimerase